MNPQDVIGLHGIAIKCDVSKATVQQWRTRFGDFPTPAHLGPTSGRGSQPWWDWSEVEAWLDLHPSLGNRT